MKLLTVPTPDGKLTPELVAERLTRVGDEHASSPASSRSPSRPSSAPSTRPRRSARWPSSPTSTGCSCTSTAPGSPTPPPRSTCRLRALTTDAGVDVLSFGGTKNGLLLGEAVVFLRPELARDFLFIRKQSMQLASKMRFLAAQFDALLGGDLWRRNASHANAMARRLAEAISADRRRGARLPGGGQRRLRHPARRRRSSGCAPRFPPSSRSTSGTRPRARSADVLLGHDRGGRRRPRVAATRRSGADPLRAPPARIAQLVEHLHGKEGVVGSSPTPGFR